MDSVVGTIVSIVISRICSKTIDTFNIVGVAMLNLPEKPTQEEVIEGGYAPYIPVFYRWMIDATEEINALRRRVFDLETGANLDD